jgi:Pyruvate/2-oxoacid:ferredoxin oxidoreductase delta subunit
MNDRPFPAKVRDFLVRPSTRAFFVEGRRTPNYSLFDWLHGYVYGRWPYLYIGIGTGEHWLARVFGPLVNFVGQVMPNPKPEDNSQTRQRITFADTYHGKVVPIQAAKQLVMVNEDIRLTNLEQVIPYALARDIVIRNPDHIIVLECPCRSARSHPCLPLDVCLIIGEPFASFVAEHHPRRSRWINAAQAVDILQAEEERGHVHHAFFKDAMLGRFYAICNCCACCCGAMQAQRNGTPMLASSGYVCQVDEDLCLGCGECQQFCQFEALSLGDVFMQVDQEKCMGCGVCVSQCVNEALSLSLAPEKGEPLNIIDLLQTMEETV